MIKSITLKFGSAPTQQPLMLDVAPVTIFVGPNNSGKSKVLSELHDYCKTGEKHHASVILDHVVFGDLGETALPGIVRVMKQSPRINEIIRPGGIIVGKHNQRQHVQEQDFVESLKNPNSRTQSFCRWFLSFHTLMLDGKSRMNLVNEQPASDLQQLPHNVLDILFREDTKRLEVRRIINDAFNTYFVVDPTALGNFRIRLSSIEPTTHLQERGIHDEAVKFHANALNISEASDGVKAFTGIITQIVAGDPSVILIDEPKAFLHPSLSFKLGKEVAISAAKSDKRLFVSTHSASFVMGCIQSGAPINIVRLTYLGGIPTARTLPNSKILRLMRNPLLRSTGVLNGLFYQSVVVTESDSDRAFYQEINERLLRYHANRGIPNCLFLNAQNKQTIHQIIQPLRELGIPTGGIVDVDVLKDGGKTWTDFLHGGFVPEVSHAGLGTIRANIRQKCDQSGKDMKRDGGVAILDESDKEAANNLFDQLAAYGLFVVRSGELESWLKPLGAVGHGPAWLVQVFEKMGENPDNAAYVKPNGGDVWQFIETIGTWLQNPKRKGIPAGST
jgi:hypothetical protein